MEQAEIIQGMLNSAKHHDLEMECIISLINNLTDGKLSDDDLSLACEEALLDWDI